MSDITRVDSENRVDQLYNQENEAVETKKEKTVKKSPLDEVSTDDIFDYLVSRVTDDSAKSLIQHAKKEFNQLVGRTGEREAMTLVGEVLTDKIRTMLGAAKNNENA